MFTEMIITALLIPFVSFSIWFMKKTVMKFINTMDIMLETNKKFSIAIEELTKEVKRLSEQVNNIKKGWKWMK